MARRGARDTDLTENTMTPVARLFTCLAALTIISACSSDGSTVSSEPPDPVQDATVTLRSSSFSPNHVAVFAGGSVTWNNTSGETHNVTFSSGGSPANIANHSSGSNSRDFTTAGTFNYQCTLHAGMNGRVTVVQ